MNRPNKLLPILSGIGLTTGTTVGAGMLGIPFACAEAGFFPAMLITCLAWLFMYLTGLFFLETTLWMPQGSHFLSITKHFLGKKMCFFTGCIFAFLYYCLLSAYFAAGAPLLVLPLQVLGLHIEHWQAAILFELIFGTIVAIGPKWIDRTNLILSLAMMGFWLMLVGSGSEEVEISRLTSINWPLMVFALPVLFSAFGFHNIIPSLCSYLNRDRRVLRLALFWGSLIPLIIYLVWEWLTIGSVPRDMIARTLLEGRDITAAFRVSTEGLSFVLLGRFFAFFAIVTSTLGVAFSMVDFLGDGLKIKERKGKKRLLLTVLTFVPPLIFSLSYPALFDLALGIAGGFGEAFLNGLLPIGLVGVGHYIYHLKSDLKYLTSSFVLIVLSLYALFVIGIEAYRLIL